MRSIATYSGTGGRDQVFNSFRRAMRSTKLTMGEDASASGSAQTEKRGATGKPFFTWGFIASGEAIQAMALTISRLRSAVT